MAKQLGKPQELTPKAISLDFATVRDQRVMLESDLTPLYGVETRALVQAVKRNRTRFPDDFIFQLTAEEFQALKSQSVISNTSGRDSRHPNHAYFCSRACFSRCKL